MLTLVRVFGALLAVTGKCFLSVISAKIPGLSLRQWNDSASTLPARGLAKLSMVYVLHVFL